LGSPKSSMGGKGPTGKKKAILEAHLRRRSGGGNNRGGAEKRAEGKNATKFSVLIQRVGAQVHKRVHGAARIQLRSLARDEPRRNQGGCQRRKEREKLLVASIKEGGKGTTQTKYWWNTKTRPARKKRTLTCRNAEKKKLGHGEGCQGRARTPHRYDWEKFLSRGRGGPRRGNRGILGKSLRESKGLKKRNRRRRVTETASDWGFHKD